MTGTGQSALTPKQEAFALAYVETGNASEAYRRAYAAGNMKPNVINVKASELLADGKIAVRVAELQAKHAERHNFTVDDMIAQLDEDRAFARAKETPAAAVTASMGKAKLLGFLTDKVQHLGLERREIPPEEIAVRMASLVARMKKQNPAIFDHVEAGEGEE